jgi:hypothetical protein
MSDSPYHEKAVMGTNILLPFTNLTSSLFLHVKNAPVAVQGRLLTELFPMHARLVNNQREAYQFRFNTVFPASSSQEKVCSAPVCPACLHQLIRSLFRPGRKPLKVVVIRSDIGTGI